MLNILFLLTGLSLAEDDTKLLYSSVTKGEKVPYNGILLTHESMAEIIATHESELKTCGVNSSYELLKQKNELDLKYELYSAKCENEKILYEEMIKYRDEELKKDRIKDAIQRTAFFSGFILGATSCVVIVNSLN